MQERIRGIVLRTVKYKESGLIVDLFTETHGRMSFMTSIGHGGSRKSAAAALWRPLNFVEFVADTHAQNRLARPRDVVLYCHYADIPYNATKSMMALFLAEFLSYTLRAQQPDEPLYRFVETSMSWLDAAPNAHIANFHLYFLIRLTRFVGIEPDTLSFADFCHDSAIRKRAFMALAAPKVHAPLSTSLPLRGVGGGFSTLHASGLHTILQPDEMRYLPLMLRISLANLHHYRFSRTQRHRVLEILEKYYRLHLPSFPELRSLDVLREVFE